MAKYNEGANELKAIMAKKKGSKLCVYASKGNMPAIKRLVEKKAPLDFLDDRNSFSPLHYAAENGHKEVLLYLQMCGAKSDQKGRNGITILLLAVIAKVELDIIKLLCGPPFFADVDVQTEKEGISPMFLAARDGNLPLIEYLTDSEEALCNATNCQGWTPLHAAVKGGHQKVVTALLERGTNLNPVDVDQYTSHMLTPLMIAAYFDQLDMARYLLDKGAKLNMHDRLGRKYHEITPAHIAARRGYLDIVEFLHGKGADCSNSDSSGITPVYLAAQFGHVDVLKYILIKHPEDMIRPDFEGWTPLHIAAQQGHRDVIKYLMERKVDVNCCTEKGFTIPMISAYYGHLDIIMFLVKNDTGIDLNISTEDGTTASSIAVKQGLLKIVKVLQDKGALSTLGRPRANFVRPAPSTAVKPMAFSDRTETLSLNLRGPDEDV
jgi:ankyrin repeat protein